MLVYVLLNRLCEQLAPGVCFPIGSALSMSAVSRLLDVEVESDGLDDLVDLDRLDDRCLVDFVLELGALYVLMANMNVTGTRYAST